MEDEKLNKPLKTDSKPAEDGSDPRPPYVTPTIVTYTSEEIIEQIGPALTCSPCPSGFPG